MTVSAAGLQRALDQLADLRTAPVTIEEALDRVVESADALFQVDGTALMLVDRDQVLRNLAASDHRAAALEELQAEHGEGPCVDAFDDKKPAWTDDLGREERWPGFSGAAVRRDLLAVLASPIPYSDQAVGVVTVFAAEPHGWTEGERQAIVAFTDLVALLILNAMEARERGRLASQLQGALDSRVVIEQAKGVLVGRHGLTTRQAFERLRRLARDQRRPLAAVALAREQGVATVVHVSCRDRNRLALRSQVIGAAALGSEAILCLYGDPVPDVPRVRDYTTTRLLAEARQWAAPSDLALGCVADPFGPDREAELALLGRKVAAGAEFVQTQMVFAPEDLAGFLDRAAEGGKLGDCRVHASVPVIRTARMVDILNQTLPCQIPEAAARQIAAGGGIDLAIETAMRLARLDRVHALHVMSWGSEEQAGTVAAAFRAARGAPVERAGVRR